MVFPFSEAISVKNSIYFNPKFEDILIILSCLMSTTAGRCDKIEYLIKEEKIINN